MASYTDVPWDLLRIVLRKIRSDTASIERPDGAYISAVIGDQDDFNELFGGGSYAPNWEFSYYFEDEDANLAQVVYDDEGEHYYWDRTLRDIVLARDGTRKKIVWWQTHVRGWNEEDGRWEIRPHWEPEPTENDQAHIDMVGYDPERGFQNVEEYLDEHNISHERIFRKT